MDFRDGASDSVPHQHLLVKLSHVWIKGDLNWIEDFLTGKSQQISVDGFSLTWEPVSARIPHGSVLDSSFIVFIINDLSSVVSSTVKIFFQGYENL